MLTHEPVLLEQVLSALSWKSEKSSISVADFTCGGGGHLYSLLESNPRPQRIFAGDQDLYAQSRAKERLATFEPIEWFYGNFRQLRTETVGSFDRILVDLGVSSFQLDEASRGFSFQKDGPLDMRMDPDHGSPASEILMHCGEAELAKVLWEWGDEKFSRKIARRWMEERKRFHRRESLTTKTFVESLGFQLDSKTKMGRHPLTKVFQALRIWVNDEVGALEELLQNLPSLLRPQGQVALITFHSLEDRCVKWNLKNRLNPVLAKPQVASAEEMNRNPRSRSAKLRVFERGADQIDGDEDS